MSMFSAGPRNEPRPPRPPRPMPPGDVASKPKPRKDSGQGGVSKEESKSRLRDAQRLMPIPQRPSKSRPLPPGLEGQDRLMPIPQRPSKSRPLPPGLEGQDRLMPIPRRSEPMSMPPGLEGQQYLAPGGMGADTFLEGMGQNVMSFLRGGDQDQPMEMPFLRRSFDPGTDALLRAYMRQMQGGE